MKFRRILIFIFIFFALLDGALILDERYDLFSGLVVGNIEKIKDDSRQKIDQIKNEPLPPPEPEIPGEPEEINNFRNGYPDLVFSARFDEKNLDWRVTVTVPSSTAGSVNRQAVFYWADGRLLPEKELQNKENYSTLLYPYHKLKDPALMTEEEILKIREFASAENRKESLGTPSFFFDFLYSAKSQVIIEDYMVRMRFLGRKTRVHERVKAPFLRVEQKIIEAGKTDAAVKAFIDGVKSADAYNWRIIDGTGRKSFHSYGVAMDILPRRYGGKVIFWSWAKENDPENWMLIPLNRRWSPPQKVIDIFEEEGFIWGGNWIIFDNMHFEYHPELLQK